MKKYFIKKEITAILFVVILFSFSIINLIHTYPILKEKIKISEVNTAKEINSTINQTENIIDENVFGKYYFIEAYGAAQLILNKHECNNFNVVVDKDGFSYDSSFIDGWNDDYCQMLTSGMEKFNEDISNNNTKLIVMTIPDKFYDNQINGYTGIPYINTSANIDSYYSSLNEKNVECIDIRQDLIESGYSKEQLYFKTDHHWTTLGAFIGFRALVDTLNEEYDAQIDTEGFYTDINNYNEIVYENAYIGSYGRKDGRIYHGVESFSILFPAFNTDYDVIIEKNSVETKYMGSFEDTVFNKAIFNSSQDFFNSDMYSCYLDGVIYPYGKITNNKINDGKKILLIRDSYSSSLAAFLSTCCSEVDVLYPIEFKGDVKEFIKENDYDYVIVTCYSGTLEVDGMYDYLFEKEQD